jgi:hypothetical protein
MSTSKRRVPYSEYRKRKQALRKAHEQERAIKTEEKRQQELAWAERSQRLIQAEREHPIAYFLGNTDAQREIYGKTTITNTVLGLGKVTDSNPSGTMGWLTSLLLLVLFFPLLLLSHPRQLPGLGIISFVALGVECYRYKKGTAFKQEWKAVLGVLAVIGWIFLLSLRIR